MHLRSCYQETQEREREGMWEEWKRLPWLSMQKGTMPVLFATEFWNLVCGRLQLK